jgi:hypothetical protein
LTLTHWIYVTGPWPNLTSPPPPLSWLAFYTKYEKYTIICIQFSFKEPCYEFLFMFLFVIKPFYLHLRTRFLFRYRWCDNLRSKTRDHTQRLYTVKKELAIFPSPAGMSLTKLSLAGNILLIPGQGEFSDGKIATPFLQCIS